MSHKSLNLDLNKIEQAVNDFDLDEKPIISTKGNGKHYIFKKNNQEGKIILYFKNDGTTTISPAGKNKELAEELANHIKRICLFTEQKNGVCSVPAISDEELNSLLEYIYEDVGAKLIEHIQQENSDKYK